MTGSRVSPGVRNQLVWHSTLRPSVRRLAGHRFPLHSGWRGLEGGGDIIAKLKCMKHDRRVMVLMGSHKVVHREDGSNCESDKIMHKGRVFAPDELDPDAMT
jgi:hypothetical protein